MDKKKKLAVGEPVSLTQLMLILKGKKLPPLWKQRVRKNQKRTSKD